MPFIDSFKQALLNHIFGDPALTAYTDLSLRLFVSAPTEAGTGGTAVTGFSDLALSEAADFDAAAGGGTSTKSNGVLFDFGTKASGGSQTIVGVGIVSAVDGLLMYGALTASQTVDDGQQFQIAIGDLDISMD